MDKLNTLLLLALVGLVGISVFTSSRVEMETVNPIGSVSVSNEYQSIQTGNSLPANGTVLKPVPGVLGSVIVTTTATGVLTIYNATTSNVTLRALATSSLEIIAILANPVVGTYTYDIEADQGMIVKFDGIQASTTITFR